jgi:hypothetical protein
VALLFGTGAHWSYWAYNFEFEGDHTFKEIWIAGNLIFVGNIVSLVLFIYHHELGITKEITDRKIKV